MRIAYYMPMKSFDHPVPSGDRVIGEELFDYLKKLGHEPFVASGLRTRWIYWRPQAWISWIIERERAIKAARGADLWLTYHGYYKAPDLLGPVAAKTAGIPYAIFQGAYATKYRKKLKSWPGFYLNRHALCLADLVFANKHVDFENLKRLLPPERLHYVRPGLAPGLFAPDSAARERLRREWEAGEAPVVLSAAMLRADVKARGIEWVIDSLAQLASQGIDFRYVVAGDGPERGRLQALADTRIPGKTVFLGHVAREEMAGIYSAADLLAFPGINESFGMAYLEAQACGLPVVAFKGWGVPEAVANFRSGLLSEPFDREAFTANLKTLVQDGGLRARMGAKAMAHVREAHDRDKNYQEVASALEGLAAKHHGEAD